MPTGALRSQVGLSCPLSTHWPHPDAWGDGLLGGEGASRSLHRADEGGAAAGFLTN